LKTNNESLYFQIEHLKSSTSALDKEQRTQLDKTIIRITEDLAKLRKREQELLQENDELSAAVNSIHSENHEIKSKLRTVHCELELEKSTKMLRDDNNKALEQKVKILADNNKLLAKQVENFATLAMSDSPAKQSPIKKSPVKQSPGKKSSKKSSILTSPISTDSFNNTRGPPNEHTKFIPLTLKYSTHGNESMNCSKISKSSKTSKVSHTSKNTTSEANRSNRRKTHIGSSTSTPRNSKYSDSWFTSPETVSSKTEEHACQFCGKIFTDFRKVIKHIDTCEGV